jgi:hypothetical protein
MNAYFEEHIGDAGLGLEVLPGVAQLLKAPHAKHYQPCTLLLAYRAIPERDVSSSKRIVIGLRADARPPAGACCRVACGRFADGTAPGCKICQRSPPSPTAADRCEC